MVISAAVSYTLIFPMAGNVAQQGAVTVTYDGNYLQQWRIFLIDWGTVAPGQTYTKSVTIHNGVNTPVTPGITSTLSTTYGTISLSSNNPIAPNSDATVDVVLTVSSTAPAGAIPAWTATFTANA